MRRASKHFKDKMTRRRSRVGGNTKRTWKEWREKHPRLVKVGTTAGILTAAAAAKYFLSKKFIPTPSKTDIENITDNINAYYQEMNTRSNEITNTENKINQAHNKLNELLLHNTNSVLNAAQIKFWSNKLSGLNNVLTKLNSREAYQCILMSND
jgi:predicted PurR-regulated permease PerM